MGVWEYGSMGVWEYGSLRANLKNARISFLKEQNRKLRFLTSILSHLL